MMDHTLSGYRVTFNDELECAVTRVEFDHDEPTIEISIEQSGMRVVASFHHVADFRRFCEHGLKLVEDVSDDD